MRKMLLIVAFAYISAAGLAQTKLTTVSGRTRDGKTIKVEYYPGTVEDAIESVKYQLVDELQAKANSLQAKVDAANKQIQQLKNQTQNGSNTSELMSQIASKDAEINELNEHIANLEQQQNSTSNSAEIKWLRSQISDKEKQIENLNEQLTQLRKDNQNIDEKQTEIKLLQSSIVEKETQVQDLENQITNLNSVITQLRNDMGDKDKAIDSLSTVKPSVVTVVANDNKNNEEIARLRDSINLSDNELKRLRDSIGLSYKEMKRLRDSISTKDMKINSLSKELADCEKEVNELQKGVTGLTKPKKTHSIGLEASVGPAFATGKLNNGWDKDVTTTWDISLYYGTPRLAENFPISIEVGVGLRQVGLKAHRNACSITIDDTDADADNYKALYDYSDMSEKASLTYLNIPIRICFGQPARDRVTAYAKIGLTPSINVTSSFNADGTYSLKGYYPQWDLTLSNVQHLGFGDDINAYTDDNTPTVNKFVLWANIAFGAYVPFRGSPLALSGAISLDYPFMPLGSSADGMVLYQNGGKIIVPSARLALVYTIK